MHAIKYVYNVSGTDWKAPRSTNNCHNRYGRSNTQRNQLCKLHLIFPNVEKLTVTEGKLFQGLTTRREKN